MKKIFSLLLILTILSPFFIVNSYSEDNNSYFIVTAYYSPLPGQKYYLTWDYESEKRLNGEWIAWASWKWVFSWMLAAPKNYKFWTKIYLEWLWIWDVQDRWWAIVNAGKRWYNYDRIDVWVWYWDEWLKRALYWWKRKVKWYITDSSLDTTIDYNKLPSPDWVTKWLKKISNVFDTWIWKWSDSIMVKKLQSLLNEIWLYNWNIDWIYNDEIIDIVYNFQIENEIVKWPFDYWAGYWWNKTRSLFLKLYLNWEFDNINQSEKSNNNEIVKKEDIKKDIKTETNTKYQDIFKQAIQNKNDTITLQEILKQLWLYEWELTWNYDDIIWVIYNYQLDKDIVKWEYSHWAWNFWPITRTSMKETYNKYLENKEQERLEQERIEKEKELEKLRKKELEEKYKKLEEKSLEKAEEKISLIGKPKFWEVSIWVRILQQTLNKLWHFTYKDTAIFWEITKESIFSYQVSKNLVKTKNDPWAWMIWPITLWSIKNDLKNIYLNDLIKESWLKEEELAQIKSDSL